MPRGGCAHGEAAGRPGEEADAAAQRDHPALSPPWPRHPGPPAWGTQGAVTVGCPQLGQWSLCPCHQPTVVLARYTRPGAQHDSVSVVLCCARWCGGGAAPVPDSPSIIMRFLFPCLNFPHPSRCLSFPHRSPCLFPHPRASVSPLPRPCVSFPVLPLGHSRPPVALLASARGCWRRAPAATSAPLRPCRRRARARSNRPISRRPRALAASPRPISAARGGAAAPG